MSRLSSASRPEVITIHDDDDDDDDFVSPPPRKTAAMPPARTALAPLSTNTARESGKPPQSQPLTVTAKSQPKAIPASHANAVSHWRQNIQEASMRSWNLQQESAAAASEASGSRSESESSSSDDDDDEDDFVSPKLAALPDRARSAPTIMARPIPPRKAMLPYQPAPEDPMHELHTCPAILAVHQLFVVLNDELGMRLPASCELLEQACMLERSAVYMEAACILLRHCLNRRDVSFSNWEDVAAGYLPLWLNGSIDASIPFQPSALTKALAAPETQPAPSADASVAASPRPPSPPIHERLATAATTALQTLPAPFQCDDTEIGSGAVADLNEENDWPALREKIAKGQWVPYRKLSATAKAELLYELGCWLVQTPPCCRWRLTFNLIGRGFRDNAGIVYYVTSTGRVYASTLTAAESAGPFPPSQFYLAVKDLQALRMSNFQPLHDQEVWRVRLSSASVTPISPEVLEKLVTEEESRAEQADTQLDHKIKTTVRQLEVKRKRRQEQRLHAELAEQLRRQQANLERQRAASAKREESRRRSQRARQRSSRKNRRGRSSAG